jgi:uncharacterized membrane protein YkgB
MLDAISTDRPWERRLAPTGLFVLRYGLVFLLVAIGIMKFFELEAIAIRPLVEHSPLMSWMIDVFGLRGASALIGVCELIVGGMMLTRRWLPRVSGYGSLAAAGTFLVTLSFLFTTPNAPTGFLLKDLILLGAALFTAAEAFAAAKGR